MYKDVEWFLRAVEQIRCNELEGEEMASPEPYFVDFLREAPEPTGEEPDDADLEAPKVYEMVSDLVTNLIIGMWTCVTRCPVLTPSLRS